jgi:hypothetical protein
MAARHPLDHPPTGICHGNQDEDDPNKSRVLVADPETGRGFVYSTDQTAKGRPELLFLDTLGDLNVMISVSRIITDYDEAGTLPNDKEVIHKDPFHEGFPLTFIARVIDDDNQHLKKELERLYLHSTSEHGIIVLVPIMMKNRVVTEGGKLWYVLVFRDIVSDSTCTLIFADLLQALWPDSGSYHPNRRDVGRLDYGHGQE